MLNVHAYFFWQNCPDVFILPSSQRCPLGRIQNLTWTIQGRQQNKNSVFVFVFFKSSSNISHIDYKIIIVDYVIHQIYSKSYIIYHVLCITYFHQIRKWKLRSQIFFMVGVWLSGVFIFAGDNKYDSVKSNYQLKELLFILIMTAFTKSTKPCKRVTTIPNQLRPSPSQLCLLTTLQLTFFTQRQLHFFGCVKIC